MKNNIKKSIFPGIIIGLFLTIGYFIKRNGEITGEISEIGILIAFLIGAVAFVLLFYTLADIFREKEAKKKTEYFPNKIIKKSWQYGFICFVILMVAWTPTYLALLPGLFVYDAPWQYYMYYYDGVTAHQPVLHTYMIGWIFDLVKMVTGSESVSLAVAGYTFFQMCIMAVGEAYILYVFHREKLHTFFHVTAIIFYGIFPTCTIFVMTVTKDSFFAIATAVFCVTNTLLLKDVKKFFERRQDVVVWLICALAVLIFRNNAKYAMIVTLPFFVIGLMCAINKISQDKKERKTLLIKCAALLTTVITIYTIYDIPITKVVTINGISTAEMLSVPCQQLARVYNYRNGDLNDNQKKTIEKLFQNDEKLMQYVPQIADNTKGVVDTELIKSDMVGYLFFWAKLGIQFPGEYINSFLENTYAFWYPWPEYVIYADGRKSYTPMTSVPPAYQKTVFHALYNFYQKFAEGKIADGDSAIACIFSPALYFYVYLLTAVYCLNQKKKHTYISLLAVCLIWMTFLLGPVAQIRYSLYLLWLFPCYPLLIKGEKKD